jgi:hypothetical protein
MATFEVHEFPEKHPTRRFTFTVDGLPSGMWFPTRHAADRCVLRLKLGRSGEAFGGAGLTAAGASVGYAALDGNDRQARAKVEVGGEVTTETVEAKSGRTKPREKRPGYVVTLDGLAYEGGTNEQEAKGLAAVQAFLTRGKFGLKEEACEAFKDAFGKCCRVHHFGHKLVAKDEDGGLWWVGVNLKAALTKKYTFKPVLGNVQLTLGAEIGGLTLKAKA